MMTKHTPTPWRIDGSDGDRVYRVRSPADVDEFSCLMHNEAYYPVAPEREDAAFIVRAVNHHEALVEIVRVLIGDVIGEEDAGDMVAYGNAANRARSLLAALDADNA